MKYLNKLLPLYKKLALKLKARPEIVALIVLLIAGYVVMTRGKNKTVYVYEKQEEIETSKRLLGNPSRDAYRQKRMLLEKKIRGINKLQRKIVDSLEKIESRLNEVETQKEKPQDNTESHNQDNVKPDFEQMPSEEALPKEEKVTFSEAKDLFEAKYSDYEVKKKDSPKRIIKKKLYRPKREVVTFPVKRIEKPEEVVILPAGSYVKGKILTGVEVGSKTLPVLTQLDYAYIAPSNKTIDLKGCFMIMKSQGDLSTEKVELQGKTLSCVNKKDQFFEREINSFVADHKDNSYGVNAELKSNQGRVAMMAFTSSVVERLSELIKGESRNNVAKQGGVDAGSMVAQWYLKHAMGLAPTLKINSSQDVWVVMTTTTKLPKKYFKGKVYEKSHHNITY